MKFSQEDASVGYLIQRYEKGRITISGQIYLNSLIVTPEQIIENWGPDDFASLSIDHFADLTKMTPELVLLGTGETHRFPTINLVQPLVERQIGLEAMDTAAACRTYNILMSEGRKVAAALLMI